MKRSLLTCCVIGTSLALCASALAQDEKKPATPAKPDAAKPAQPDAKKPAEPSHDEMMKQWMDANKPGKEHTLLQTLAGEWDLTVKTFMDPTGPKESKATEKAESVLGGLFVQHTVNGTMMEMPFQGIGFGGYNNMTKKYESIWMDNMSTLIMLSTGTYDEKTKTLKFTGTYDDPMSGGKKTTRSERNISDPNRHVLKFFEPGPDGKEALTMEITYVRKSGAKPTAPAAPATRPTEKK